MYADHFQPEKILATGPSAKVHRGVETATGRKVLIKVLLPDNETAQPLNREQLQLLAPALMQMRHPQIAGLITLLPAENEFALVSEFMPGMNARTFAANRKPSPADLRALAVQLMHALLVGEQLRQPHGDPKPSNIIIADHPGGGLFLQVQDWGLSLARRTHPPETLWFRAPELHAGGYPTTQSDLFTAAGSLFCIATNAAPAQGTTVEEVLRDWHAFNAGHVLSHLRPDLDPPLRDWLAWLLNLAPQLRPHSVAQALDVLMRSMHTGFSYMPPQAPAMMPGVYTAQLAPATPPPVPQPTASVAAPQPVAVPPAPQPAASAPAPKPIASPSAPQHAASSPAPKPVASPSAPKSKPFQAKPASAVAAPVTSVPTVSVPATSKKPAVDRRRVLVAGALNFVALSFLGFCLWPTSRQSSPTEEVTAAVSESPKTVSASPKAQVKAGKNKAAAVAAKHPTAQR